MRLWFKLTRGPFLLLGNEGERGDKMVPSKIGEAAWTLLGDNTWPPVPNGTTLLVAGPKHRP